MVLLSQSGMNIYRCCVAAALSLCLLLSVGTLQAADKPVTEPVTDLRILVDVSGSMKRNDPKNLRRDALRLLIGMLPKTSRAGIWSFGQYVNMQVKPGFATSEWKKNARKEANNIHSRGLYTNIEDTLTKSSWDWRRPDPKWDRHMILLTDGMVDISKQASKNTASRHNILNKILGDLQKANVKVHTIALSSQADHELLKALAKKSDGWYESVDSAERLQRIFLGLFEKTTKMDSLPLEENYFDVDKSIDNMTLLVFRSKSGVATNIIRPDGSSFSNNKLPKNVEWYQDKSFDIVTVNKPVSGKWKLGADIDKDNRVKVVTNLKLRVDRLPTNIIKDEKVNIKASLLTKQALLNDEELLALTKVSLLNINQQGEKNEQPMAAADVKGSYEAIVNGLDTVGDIEMVVRVNSPTFKRESRHVIKVHENPINLELSATPKGLVISVTEDPKLLQTGTLQLALSIEGQKGAYYVLKDSAHTWKAIVDNSFEGKNITINASANRLGNVAFRSQLHGKLPKAIKPLPDPLKIWAEESESGLVIRAMLTENILQTGTLRLAYKLKDSTDVVETVIKQEAANLWQQLLLPKHSGETLDVAAHGRGLNGESFNKSYVVVVPEMVAKPKTVVEEIAVVNESDAVLPDNEEPKEDVDESLTDSESVEEDSNLAFVMVVVLLSNIILFVGGYFAYRYWKKRDQPIGGDIMDDATKDNDKEEKLTDKSTVDTGSDIETDIEEVSSVKNEAVLDEEDGEEDFSSQRKEKTTPGNVDLDVGGEESVELAVEKEVEKVSEESEILDTASADDLPEFSIDLESELDDEEASAEETPAEETPAEETPVEETPAEEISAEETPAEETPAEEISAEETQEEVQKKEVESEEELKNE